jgi:hypothetical protein
MLLVGSRVWNSSRDLFFGEDGTCFVSFYCRHFLQFDYDLTNSRAWLRHQSMQNLIRNTVMLSDWHRVGNSCRNPFFCNDGKCFVSFFFRHFLHFVYDLTVSQTLLRPQSTQNLMRKMVMLSDWRRVRNLSRNPFFCGNGISPFLENSIGINQRGIQWGLQWYHWIGVELETCVAIRFFVTR